MSGQQQNLVCNENMSFLDVMLILARRSRMILGITIVTAIISVIAASSIQPIYASDTKLLVLEFFDQTKMLRVGNNGQLVYGKKEGYWKPTDASILKVILESSDLKLTVSSKLGGANYAVQVKQGNQLGGVVLKVEGENPELTAKVAAAMVKEAGQMAFRMGILAAPIIFLDEKVERLEATTMAVSVLEPAKPGMKVRPKKAMIVLLVTMMGLFCSVVLALVLEIIQNMSNEDRACLAEINAAFRCKGVYKDRSDQK